MYIDKEFGWEMFNIVCPKCGHKFEGLFDPKEDYDRFVQDCPECKTEIDTLIFRYPRGLLNLTELEWRQVGWGLWKILEFPALVWVFMWTIGFTKEAWNYMMGPTFIGITLAMWAVIDFIGTALFRGNRWAGQWFSYNHFIIKFPLFSIHAGVRVLFWTIMKIIVRPFNRDWRINIP
jgi:hypothetical protein